MVGLILCPAKGLSNLSSPQHSEHRALLTLAIPMILSNISIPILGLVDSAVIGHLSHSYYLGATAVGSMIVSFVVWMCSFLRMATTGLVSQAYGAQSRIKNFSVLLNGLMVALVLSVTFIALQALIMDWGLTATGASAEVSQYAAQYISVRVWGYPASIGTIVLLGWLLGNHQSKSVMWLLLTINSVNIVLDVLFVVVFDWKVQGVAVATLIAEYTGLIVGLYLVYRQISDEDKSAFQHTTFYSILKKVNFKDYLSLNRDILIRTLCLQLCFTFITIQGARMGDTVVAANALLMNFLLLISFGLDGIANAAEARVGRAFGAKDRAALLRCSYVAMQWSVIFAVFYSVLFLIFGEAIITLITSIPEVIDYAKQFLFWIVALPLLACWCFLLDGIYIGLTQAKAMRNGMLMATFCGFFPAWYLLQSWGNHGLWAAFCLFMLMRGITLFIHFYRHVLNNKQFAL